MQQKTYNKYKKLINDIAESGLSINTYFKSINEEASSFFNGIRNIKEQDDEFAKEIIDLYNELTLRPCSNNKKEPEDSDDVMGWWADRNENGIIVKYHIHYPVKDSVPFDTTLTRQDVETLFGLYTYYGGNITSRQVANEFPKYTLAEVKRIFRVFKLTKDSIFAPPHMMEEFNEEQLAQYRMNLKERAAFKYCDSKQERDFTNQIKKMASEINRLTDKQEVLKELISENIIVEDKFSYNKDILKSKTFLLYLSDLHIGSHNEKESYIYLEEYDKIEIEKRLSRVFAFLATKNYDNIIVVNLGDSIDSYNKQTTRGGHELPSVLSNKEQSKLYLQIMFNFFSKLKKFCNNINYYCVGESNHDGDWGWINNIALSSQLNNIGINTYVSSNPIDTFNVNDVSIIFLHGKDNKNQFKGFPLTLNERTENWFNKYFLDSGISWKKYKCVVKGDLHQPAFTNCNTFDYYSAPSLYACSNWVVANFGKTKWGILYMEIDQNNNITSGLIRE